ncbi:hypothetical protein, partial [Salmonella sp. s51228]|uniref:hypothetical protein n=1 Tax=Salmonella sp. s51228 TaxID=3159652 RepID=UPI0039805108
MKNYKPEISLPYVDDYGMDLTQKEAFRILSHRFHGKGPGKMKMERRQKKAAEELCLQKMNSVDTPLNTGAMMRRKMENSETAFLALSGGQSALQPVTMSKT